MARLVSEARPHAAVEIVAPVAAAAPGAAATWMDAGRVAVVAAQVATEATQQVQLQAVVQALSDNVPPAEEHVSEAEMLTISEESSREAALAELHSAGFVKVSGNHLDAPTLRAVLNTNCEKRIGPARRMGTCSTWAKKQQQYYSKLARMLGLMAAPAGMMKHVPVDEVMALVTEATDVLGERHADSAPRDSLRNEPLDAVPLVMLHAVMGGSKLWVWPQDGRPRTLVELKEGEILVMRGDCGHQGDCYAAENLRVHAFIECCQKSRKRPRSEPGKRDTYAF